MATATPGYLEMEEHHMIYIQFIPIQAMEPTLSLYMLQIFTGAKTA